MALRAVITGAGRGIGRATAVLLARGGGQIGLVARSIPELEETAALVTEAGGQALVVPADVSDEEQVRRCFRTVEETWGELDVLVNNAGSARFSRIESTSIEDWTAMLGVNLTGTFLCCREAIPLLRRAGGGVVVNVASSAGKKGYERQGAYVAAKHGVMGLSKVMAMELKQDRIRVHAVCPGGVDTRLAEEIHPDRDRTDWMRPEDIAEVIRFLISCPAHFTIDEVVVRRFASDVMF